jgi:hypothetical protein
LLSRGYSVLCLAIESIGFDLLRTRVHLRGNAAQVIVHATAARPGDTTEPCDRYPQMTDPALPNRIIAQGRALVCAIEPTGLSADGGLQAAAPCHYEGRAYLGERGDTERVGAHWGPPRGTVDE